MSRARHIRPTPFVVRYRVPLAFLLAFSITAAVFGGAAFYAVRRAGLPQTDVPYATAPEPLAPVAVLLFWRSDTAVDGCVLVHIDGTARTVTAIPVTPALSLLCAEDTRAAYAAAAQAVAQAVGTDTPRFAVLDRDGRAALLDALGDNLIFTVPRLGDGAPHPSAGRQTLAAAQIEQLLACPAAVFADGQEGACRLRAELTAAALTQYAVPARKTEVEADVDALLACARYTDISAADRVSATPTLCTAREQNLPFAVTVRQSENSS